MIYRAPPEGFSPRFEVVSCFLEHDGAFLLLLRHDHKPQGGTWGAPAGKVDPGESSHEAMIRELREETGHVTDIAPKLTHTLYVRFPEYDFVYHIFHMPLIERPPVVIEEAAHKDYRWVSPEEALELPLVLDMDSCIKLFYDIR